VFEALRDEAVLEAADADGAALESVAREIVDPPTREHNLWVIMITLPGCSRATAEACLDGHGGNLEAAFHEAADQQRERWEGIAHIMAQFPWLTEADAETWYEACDESPLNAILTIRRHRRLATNPEYVQRVHQRVTNVIAGGGPSDFEATEAEAELLGPRHPNPRAAWPPSVYEALWRDEASVHASVQAADAHENSVNTPPPEPAVGRNWGAATRRYEAAEVAEVVARVAAPLADPPLSTIDLTTTTNPTDRPPLRERFRERAPISWAGRQHAALEAQRSEALEKRLRLRGPESTRREALVIGSCAVCMDEERPAKVVFGGCGHLCVCQSCAHQLCTRYSCNDVLAPCPICRQVSAPVLVSAA